MRLKVAVLALFLVPLQVQADEVIDRVLGDVVLPGVTRFAEAAVVLAEVAKADCTADSPALRTAWNDAMDGWFDIQDLRFGPLDDGGHRQAIAYWPDFSSRRPRTLSRILSGQDPILKTPENYSAESVAARGLYALEAMLYDPELNGYAAGDPGCVLVQAASADLAAQAAQVQEQWQSGYADLMRNAGAPENARFLDATEARQAVFTALLASLQFDADERLGLPLGTFDHPRLLRAEGRLAGRSQRNLELSLAAHDRLAHALVPDPQINVATREDFERVRWMASSLDDPDFSGVADPAHRFKLEALQTALVLLRTEANKELSVALGVTMGLNALDGD